MLTVQEVKERLCQYDEVTLLEVLDVSSVEIIERFGDYVDEHYERLAEELENDV